MKIKNNNLGIIFIILASSSIIFAQNIIYPKTRTENAVDYFNGEKVRDPYRWLEETESPETKAWANAQDSLTHAYLDTISQREHIRNFLTNNSSLRDNSMPLKHGDRYFYFGRDGIQNQPILRMRKSLDSEQIIILDPNQLSSDGTVAITNTAFSLDGRYLAYALSYGGSDRQEVHIRDIDSGKNYDEILKWCKFVDIAWDPADGGFFYNRWPDPETVAENDQYNYSRIYWHKLGTPQSQDSLIFETPKDKESVPVPFISDDGKYFFIYVYRGSDSKLDIFYRDLESGGNFVQLMKKENVNYYYIGNQGKTFFFKTGLKSLTGKVVAIDLDKPSKKEWREIIPPSDDILEYAIMVNNQFVAIYLYSVQNIIKIFDIDGKFVRELKLPTIGTFSALSGAKEDSEMFLTFQSFVVPPTVYRYDFKSDKFEQFYRPQYDIDFSKFVTRQVYYESDHVTVPMFITYNRDLLCDGNNPTLLYGYGGFGVNMEPSFSAANLMWLQSGGVYAVANIRGGGEFGPNWHQGGKRRFKQNCFDDFTEAAKWLIKGKITSPSKLAIKGGSNGGLLVAATMEQHPDLFGAVICQVPVTDMLRYQKFTVGSKWTSEYGSVDEGFSCFKYLYSYSPIHNVKKWKKYPPILVTTGENDDRVPPLHSYKFIAALQAIDDGQRPKLLRVETEAGHGTGKPLSKTVEEQTDIYSFLFNAFGMKLSNSDSLDSDK